MSGPEQRLIPDLVAVLLGREPADDEFAHHPVPPGLLTSQGSGNWPIDADACLYIKTGDVGARGRLLAYLRASEDLWMGNEEDSTIYGGFYLYALAGVHRAAIARGDAELAAAALEWGAMFFALRRLGEAPDGTVLAVGMRSGGRSPAGADCWDRWTLALARQDAGALAAAMARGRALHLAIPQSWQAAVAPALQGSLAAMYEAGASVPDFGLAQPIHVLRWRDAAGAVTCLLVYMQAHQPGAGNGNTPPLMAAQWQAGAASYLPANGGEHFRQRFERVTMTLADGVLTYASDLEGTQVLALPPGPPAEHLVIGDRSATTVTPSPAPGPTTTTGGPGPVSPPTTTEDPGAQPPGVTHSRPPLEIAIDIRALEVAGLARRMERNEIAREVGGDVNHWRPWGAVADQLAALGPQPEFARLAAEVRGLG